jgi:hypothetical protein
VKSNILLRIQRNQVVEHRTGSDGKSLLYRETRQ